MKTEYFATNLLSMINSDANLLSISEIRKTYTDNLYNLRIGESLNISFWCKNPDMDDTVLYSRDHHIEAISFWCKNPDMDDTVLYSRDHHIEAISLKNTTTGRQQFNVINDHSIQDNVRLEQVLMEMVNDYNMMKELS